jgi:hypothetical protein
MEIRSLADIVDRLLSVTEVDYDFWEPVKVTVDLSQVPIIELDNWECPICACDKRQAHRLPCCNKVICRECGVSWFETENVKCPYCRKDLREYLSR